MSDSASRPLILDGSRVADSFMPFFAQCARKVAGARGYPPGLAVVSVGSHAPSQIYVGRKKEKAEHLGFYFRPERLPENVCHEDVIEVVEELNTTPSIDGLIIQLPLPTHLSLETILDRIDPLKDVDGLHPLNAGYLYSGSQKGIVPCTPWGCLALLDFYKIPVEGARALVIGRSVLVGRPLAALLLRRNATVTIAHRHTRALKEIARTADIVCVAAGQKNLIDDSYIHPQSVIIDVGIHKETDSVVGDVDFEKVSPHVRAISPVPGGVGPLTVMGLMRNTLRVACVRSGVPFDLC